MRRDSATIHAVEESLLREQGGICAYTGRRISIRKCSFHIEHLKPQKHCGEGDDCDYENIVACWPEPNSKNAAPYGAVLKGSWPSPDEENLFVSPLRSDCTARFKFSRQGEISAAQNDDTPAKTTIDKLGLGHKELTDLRKEAIRGALKPQGRPISRSEVEKLKKEMDRDEAELDAGQSVTLSTFCFAIRPQLDREYIKLSAIRRSKKALL